MKKRADKVADQAWDQMVERLDGVDVDARELARVEELLARGDDAPVSGEWVEQTVARVTAPMARDVPAKVVPIWGGWIKKVAAVLLGHWLITASVTAGTVVTLVLVLRPTSPGSHATMAFSAAADLVLDSSMPIETRQSALTRMMELSIAGIDTLRAVQSEPGSAVELRQLAADRLTYLSDLLHSANPPRPGPIDDSIAETRRAALDSSRTLDARMFSLRRVADIARDAVLVIRALPDGGVLGADREAYVLWLSRQLPD